MTATKQYFWFNSLFLSIVLIFFAVNSFANELPDANSIIRLSQDIKLGRETFLKDSFRLRMAYECSGEFISENDSKELRQVCGRTLNELQVIEQQLKALQKQVEDYEGDDWEQRYGATGLWRRITYENLSIGISICEVEFYSSLTYSGQEKHQLLEAVLEKVNKLCQTYQTGYLNLLQAQIQEELGQTGQKEKLLKRLLRGQYKGDTEFALSLAFLQRRQKQFSEFEKTIELSGQVRSFAGMLIFRELSGRLKKDEPANQIVEKLSPVEARLIAEQIMENEARQYHQLLDAMISKQELRLPEVLFAAAFSEDPSPKTVELLIEASRLQYKKKNKSLSLTALDIAQHSAKMAYNLYTSNPDNCEFAIEAFNNYKQISPKIMTEDLEYAYALLLCGCSDAAQGQKILQKISDSNSAYNGKAKLRLWSQEIQANRNKDPNQNLLILKQFSKSLEETDGGRFADEGLNLVEDVIYKIENFEAEPDYKRILRDCRKVAEILTKYRNESSDKLLLAEIYVLSDDVNESGFFMIEELLKESENQTEPDFLRCQARFLQKKREFEKATGVWVRLSQLVNRQSYDWWRAKYYELYCFFNCKVIDKKDIGHVINVLQGTYGKIPGPWGEKFDALKQKCIGKS